MTPELRYSGRRCQWVISREQVALWTGDMSLWGKHRELFNLRIHDGWTALLGRGEWLPSVTVDRSVATPVTDGHTSSSWSYQATGGTE